MKKMMLAAIVLMATFAAKAQITVNTWKNYTGCPIGLNLYCFDPVTCTIVGGASTFVLPAAPVPGSVPSITVASAPPCGPSPKGIIASLQFSCQPAGPFYINIGVPGSSCPPNIDLEPVPPATTAKYCFPATCSQECNWPAGKPLCISYDSGTGDISIGL